MTAIYLLLVAAGIVWMAALIRRLDLLTAAIGALIAGYIFPHAFFNADVGVTTLTVDRLAIVLIVGMLFWHLRWRGTVATSWGWSDTILAALLAYLTIRCATTAHPETDFRSHVGPWWRIIAGFWMPAVLYVAARMSPLDRRIFYRLAWGMVALGGYLALTALAEVHQQWWAVFPRFIADPELGTHFGRARGPALMSASLGVYLTASFWAAWVLWGRAGGAARLVLTGAMIAMGAGVYYTYTRSTWLGFLASSALLGLLHLPKRTRVPALVGAGLLGVALIGMGGREVTHLSRNDSDGSASHSAYQRASFAYLSLQMFRDAPWIGCGVSRFYDCKLPYLSERGQAVELESLRDLEHHNTLLSLLVETGLVGFGLYVALLTAWTSAAWQAIARSTAGSWQQAHGVLTLGVIIAFVSTALFHDLTLSPSEHWLLFLCAGVAVRATARMPETASKQLSAAATSPGQRTRVAPSAVRTRRPGSAVRLFGMAIHPLDLGQATEQILRWCAAPHGPSCKYVVTPNVDHAVMYQSHEGLRAAYEKASLVLADGKPVVWAARALQKALPERVAGSDLTPAILRRAAVGRQPGQLPSRPLRLFLLGAASGVAERARANIEQRWPGVSVVGVYSPPLGFEKSLAENRRILSEIAACQPDLLIVGFGAPKQELWVHEHARQIDAKVALCVGATIDFLAGERSRAPIWMQRSGLEWLHRLASEPRRLAGRYLRDAVVFPQLVWRDWRGTSL